MAKRKTYPNGNRKAAPKRRRNGKRRGPLAAWLESSSWAGAKALADELGISIQHMSNLLHGHSRPSVEVQAKIERVTGGAVTSASWGAK